MTLILSAYMFSSSYTALILCLQVGVKNLKSIKEERKHDTVILWENNQ